MENGVLTIDELNNLPKEAVSVLYLQTFEMLKNLQGQKLSQMPGQLILNFDEPSIFNEVEVISRV